MAQAYLAKTIGLDELIKKRKAAYAAYAADAADAAGKISYQDILLRFFKEFTSHQSVMT